MKTFGSLLRLGSRVALLALIGGPMVAVTAAPALAGKPSRNGGGGRTTVPIGNDVSYPQCATTLPGAPAFGVVGLNDGLANDLNPCLGPSTSYPRYTQSELYWAVAASLGTTSQPKASLYVNTADPGNLYNGTPIADWPTSSVTGDPYGTCTTTTATTSTGTYTVGENSPACAWQYGYTRAADDTQWLTSAADAINAQQPPVVVAPTPGSYPWWLDVETVNSWQIGTSGQAMNVADLQGMIAALNGAGVVTVGAYSTSSQWDQVTGGTTSSSGSLFGMPDWIPGAKTLSRAESNCTLPTFTGGKVTLTQWSGSPDNDYACP